MCPPPATRPTADPTDSGVVASPHGSAAAIDEAWAVLAAAPSASGTPGLIPGGRALHLNRGMAMQRILFTVPVTMLRVLDSSSRPVEVDPDGTGRVWVCSGCAGWQVEVDTRTDLYAAEALAQAHARECAPLAMLAALRGVPVRPVTPPTARGLASRLMPTGPFPSNRGSGVPIPPA